MTFIFYGLYKANINLWIPFYIFVISVASYIIIEPIYFYLKNKSYKSKINYFRDAPANYSPSVVSFLFNLKIEYKKDVLANLMFLEQKGILMLEDDKIHIIKSDYIWQDYEEHLKYLIESIYKNKSITT